MTAFSDICDIVTQSECFAKERRMDIQKKLGADGYLLTKAISNISMFLAMGNTTCSVRDLKAVDLVVKEYSLSKFKVACNTFVRAMSSEEHPLVLFFDGIQWMAVGSRQLIELLINDKELEHVLFVLAYRDEEAEKATSIFQRCNATNLVDIQLKNLDTSAIDELAYAFTGETSGQMTELSKLVEKRSEGNPSHVQFFLEAIQSERLMVFDTERGAWSLDVDEIRVSMMMLSELADILSQKIDLVNPCIKESLKVASLMGYHFSADLLLEGVCSIMNTETDRSQSFLVSI